MVRAGQGERFAIGDGVILKKMGKVQNLQSIDGVCALHRTIFAHSSNGGCQAGFVLVIFSLSSF